MTLLFSRRKKNTNASKLRLKRRSEIFNTSGANTKPKRFRALLINMTCTLSSKEQRLSMSWAQITWLLSSPRKGHSSTFQPESSQGQNKSDKDCRFIPSVCWWLCHSCPQNRRASDKPWPPYRCISKYMTLHQYKKNQDHIPTQSRVDGPPDIKISGTILEMVEHFPYLGNHLSQKVTIEAEIQHRKCCASTSFRKMWNRIFDNHNLRKYTKVVVYKAVCITTLLYGSEAWVTYRCHLKTLEKFHQRCLRRYFVSDGKIAAPMPVSSWRPTQLISRQS